MRILRLLTAVAALGFASGTAIAASPGCQLKRLASIGLQITEKGRILVPVTIKGRPLLMDLNIAAYPSSVSQATVEKLKLPTANPTKRSWVIRGQRYPGPVATLDDLEMGFVRFSGQVDVMPDAVTAKPVGGTLGMSILGQVDFELDLAHKTLRLYAHHQCGAADPVYWTTHYSSARIYPNTMGGLFIPVEIDGKPIEASFSIAKADTILFTDVSKVLFGLDEDSPGNWVARDSSGMKSVHFRAMKLTAQGLDGTNIDVQLRPPVAQCTVRANGGKMSAAGYDGQCRYIPPLIIGSGILQKLRLYFATEEDVLYFSAADATNEEALKSR